MLKTHVPSIARTCNYMYTFKVRPFHKGTKHTCMYSMGFWPIQDKVMNCPAYSWHGNELDGNTPVYHSKCRRCRVVEVVHDHSSLVPLLPGCDLSNKGVAGTKQKQHSQAGPLFPGIHTKQFPRSHVQQQKHHIPSSFESELWPFLTEQNITVWNKLWGKYIQQQSVQW